MPDGSWMNNFYDASGMRIAAVENSIRSDFTLDGGNVITENTGNGKDVRYIRGLGLIATRENQGDYAYYLHNAHGDVVNLVNGTGDVLNSYKYDAFGNSATYTETIANRFMYAGEQFDKVTGQYYLRARYYAPQVGRFITEDSYRGDPSSPLSLNLYSYCKNNPITHVDPSGHDSYVFYGLSHGGEGGFEEQAKSEQKRLKKEYGNNVYLIPVETEKQFVSAWSKIGINEKCEKIKVEEVSLLFHSNPHNLLLDYTKEEYITTYINGKTRGTTDSADATSIYSLESKSFDTLNLFTCNSGHIDIADNLAAKFIETNKIESVFAWDGSMAYNNFWGTYIPRLAFNQRAFYSWTPERIGLFGIRYKRSPIGQVEYYRENDGTINWREVYKIGYGLGH
ncbi:RHS repeat-associated core domain-containing protein [Lutispora sp.]|uniref:RHS repeat-associated core domain-containing protein n=1 Tax=Lutispora sp. TaxID=2828727 RepID=UPI003982FE9F